MSRSIYCGEVYDKVYQMNNYMIKYNDNNRASNLCVIYCSSSGLYFPNTEQEFEKAFLKEHDKYEWKNHIIKRAYKQIWIRDITKEFYVRGINSQINSIDKMIDFMKKETEGYRCILIGSSAGGYIATLLGTVLNADYVYCFSGYFNLNILNEETWPLIKEKKIFEENSKWYDLRTIITNSKTKVFYFFPMRLKGDRKQADYVKEISNVYSYALNSKVHGIPFGDRENVDRLLNVEPQVLIEKLSKFEKRCLYKFMWNKLWKNWRS